MGDVHVVPGGSDDWVLEVDGERRGNFQTQDEAISQGTQLAKQEQSELVIHGQDGQIREKHSHGDDPRDVPG